MAGSDSCLAVNAGRWIAIPHANVMAPPPLTYVPPLCVGRARPPITCTATPRVFMALWRRAADTAFEALHGYSDPCTAKAGPETPVDWQRYTAHMLE